MECLPPMLLGSLGGCRIHGNAKLGWLWNLQPPKSVSSSLTRERLTQPVSVLRIESQLMGETFLWGNLPQGEAWRLGTLSSYQTLGTSWPGGVSKTLGTPQPSLGTGPAGLLSIPWQWKKGKVYILLVQLGMIFMIKTNIDFSFYFSIYRNKHEWYTE